MNIVGTIYIKTNVVKIGKDLVTHYIIKTETKRLCRYHTTAIQDVSGRNQQ